MSTWGSACADKARDENVLKTESGGETEELRNSGVSGFLTLIALSPDPASEKKDRKPRCHE